MFVPVGDPQSNMVASSDATNMDATRLPANVYNDEGDRQLTYPPFLPDDSGNILPRLNMWATRIEGMLTRINARI